MAIILGLFFMYVFVGYIYNVYYVFIHLHLILI